LLWNQMDGHTIVVFSSLWCPASLSLPYFLYTFIFCSFHVWFSCWPP
jgi:hypothetical protein